MRTSQQEIATPDVETIFAPSQTKKAAGKTVSVKNEKTALITTKKLTLTASLVALALLFKLMGQALTIGGTFKISFTYIGWTLSAVILGPFGGAAVGAITDIMAPFILYNGFAFNPLITLGAALYPFIVGMCYRHLPFKNKSLSVVLGTALALIASTLGVTTIGIYYIGLKDYPFSFWTYLVTSRLPQLLVAGVNLVLTLVLIPVLRRIKIIEPTESDKSKVHARKVKRRTTLH